MRRGVQFQYIAYSQPAKGCALRDILDNLCHKQWLQRRVRNAARVLSCFACLETRGFSPGTGQTNTHIVIQSCQKPQLSHDDESVPPRTRRRVTRELLCRCSTHHFLLNEKSTSSFRASRDGDLDEAPTLKSTAATRIHMSAASPDDQGGCVYSRGIAARGRVFSPKM